MMLRVMPVPRFIDITSPGLAILKLELKIASARLGPGKQGMVTEEAGPGGGIVSATVIDGTRFLHVSTLVVGDVDNVMRTFSGLIS